ncbi:PREDICTED: TBC1 domain family member 10B [Nicrophorus vespilloides]|uniref:TBC1 domain family member 10B n=1 Tax=Nicrophorus vespilloides TaxID=110193 RepID=A0ABM1MY03_NICVS|nr:PREDICTED: TBC1 domain family member 10B [Nicrophorus vespilloides]
MATSMKDETESVCSESSTLVDGSVISTVPDRHGFLGGTQYSPEPRQGPSPEIILRRERKWLKMLAKWTFYMEKNYTKVRERCRKGIPMSVRPKAWAHLCGGMILMETNQEKYEHCLTNEADPKAIDDIRKDLHRQFPFHEMFCSEDKPGQKELANVLRAYVVYNPKVGYCQAQAPVAAFLLMHMPAEQAFWCLVSISDKYLKNYYSPSMEIIQRDGMILQALLKKVCTPAYKHLKKVNAEPVYYCTEWFLCAFTRTLPWDSLLRIWDIFLCAGIKVLFKVALVILVGCLGSAKNRKRCPGLCETLDLLRNPPEEVLCEDYLINHMGKLNLTEKDFEDEHKKQTLKMRKNSSSNGSR